MKLSVVTGTLNRLPLLKECIASIRASAQGLEYEMVIVDGGSTDGSLEWLRAQKDIVLIEQGEAKGAVAAFNAGFHVARGEYIANANDDMIYVGDTLASACAYLDAHPRCGQVAIPFGFPGQTPLTQILPNWLTMNLWQKKNMVYANFGVTRKTLGDAIGWWGEKIKERHGLDLTFFQYAGDPYLSTEIWRGGSTVDILEGGAIVHHAVEDATRKPNIETQLLAFIYDPHKAWERQQETTARTRRQRVRENSRRRPLHAHKPKAADPAPPKPVKPLASGIYVRYTGEFKQMATYVDTPSGQIYRVRLKPGLVLQIQSDDRVFFLTKEFEDADYRDPASL